MTRRAPCGAGLRALHYDRWLDDPLPELELVEVIIENVAGRGGRPHLVLERLKDTLPLAFHGLSLSIAGLEPISKEILREWVELERRYAPAFIGDHLCFSSFGGAHGHDLWPVPRTESMLKHVVQRVQEVQDALGRAITLENISAYVEARSNEMTSCEFLARVALESDCLILLDVNNLAVEEHNFGGPLFDSLKNLPLERVAYLHAADYSELRIDDGIIAFDDHAGLPRKRTLEGLRAVARRRPVPVVLEWDNGTPTLLADYLEAARNVAEEVYRS